MWKEFYDSLDNNKKKALGRDVKATAALRSEPNVELLNVILNEEEDDVVDEGSERGSQKKEFSETQKTKEVERDTAGGRVAVYNSDTKQFIRWK